MRVMVARVMVVRLRLRLRLRRLVPNSPLVVKHSRRVIAFRQGRMGLASLRVRDLSLRVRRISRLLGRCIVVRVVCGLFIVRAGRMVLAGIGSPNGGLVD
jgi:hypothetical protein